MSCHLSFESIRSLYASPQSLSPVSDWLETVSSSPPTSPARACKRLTMASDDETSPSPATKKQRTKTGSDSLHSSSMYSTPTKKTKIAALAKLEQLELADPKVLLNAPLSGTNKPSPVTCLEQVFEINRDLCSFVPNLPALAKFQGLQRVPTLSIQTTAPTTRDEDFFAHALDIWHMAQDVNAQALDEQNWYPCVRQTLRWPLPPRFDVYLPPPILSVIEAQNTLFDTSFIPKKTLNSNQPVDLAEHIGGVKVDHILIFNNYHSLLSPTHDTLRACCYRNRLEPPAYSPLASQVLRRRFVGVLVEVKAVAESEAGKALSQVALAASAVLEATKRLRVCCECKRRCTCKDGWKVEHMMPVLGFVVDRTMWTLRIAYWEAKGQIVCPSPPFPHSPPSPIPPFN
jgi:hypothetical protein